MRYGHSKSLPVTRIVCSDVTIVNPHLYYIIYGQSVSQSVQSVSQSVSPVSQSVRHTDRWSMIKHYKDHSTQYQLNALLKDHTCMQKDKCFSFYTVQRNTIWCTHQIVKYIYIVRVHPLITSYQYVTVSAKTLPSILFLQIQT